MSWVGLLLAGSLQLSWEAPAECPTQDLVDARIGALLSPEVLAQAPPLEVYAQVQPTADASAWELALRIETELGARTRTISSPDCESLADVTALVVALDVEIGRVDARGQVRHVLEHHRPAGML